MTEIFKPRANMVEDISGYWECRDTNGRLVCDGGPSVIWDDGKEWQFYRSGIGFHRLDGPAISKKVWYINNRKVTEAIHQFAKENGIDLNNLTDEDKILISLKFG